MDPRQAWLQSAALKAAYRLQSRSKTQTSRLLRMKGDNDQTWSFLWLPFPIKTSKNNYISDQTQKKSKNDCTLLQDSRLIIMRMKGLEPLHHKIQEPKSCASANSATSASKALKNGGYRARTCDPLLVRQMLSQLSETSSALVPKYIIIYFSISQ